MDMNYEELKKQSKCGFNDYLEKPASLIKIKEKLKFFINNIKFNS
jgi:response regulator of citrate/malate metabolism